MFEAIILLYVLTYNKILLINNFYIYINELGNKT